jgi:hypothetical protein
MLVDPDLDEIVNGPRGMLKGVDVCIQAQCLVSAVALIYSTIDALSALTRPPEKKDTNRKNFINWVKKYIRPDKTLRCSAHDLYGARCGVLHNYGPNSKLRRQGEAKALIYKWRDGPDPDPNRNIPLPADAITLYVEDLRKALSEALTEFLAGIEGDAALKQRVEHHRQELLCYRPWSAVPIRVAA